MSALAAPDKFKGTFTAREVADAIGRGLGGADLCPVADGGEGTLEALHRNGAAELREVEVRGPLGDPVVARFGIEPGGLAIVEASEALGLSRIEPSQLDPWVAGSSGVGELIAEAIAAGARRVLVACGGTATMDGGLAAIDAFDAAAAEIVALCDTRASFESAPRLFGPQKGADAAMVERLERRQRAAAHALPKDPTGVAMTGAGGGLSGALWAHGATLVPGARYVLDAVDFDQRARRASSVITGEGRLDATTLSGKAVQEIASRCRRIEIPCHAIVGSTTLSPHEATRMGLASVQEATDLPGISAAAAAIGAGS